MFAIGCASSETEEPEGHLTLRDIEIQRQVNLIVRKCQSAFAQSKTGAREIHVRIGQDFVVCKRH